MKEGMRAAEYASIYYLHCIFNSCGSHRGLRHIMICNDLHDIHHVAAFDMQPFHCQSIVNVQDDTNSSSRVDELNGALGSDSLS